MEGYLQLESGHSYKGQWLSEPLEQKIEAEIVFYTGMTGYQEVLTDPSYKDKLVVFTYPLIGNCGIKKEDFENKKPCLAGVLIYEGSKHPSHYESAYTLQEYLKKWNIPFMERIDTRAIIKKAHAKKSMKAVLYTNNPAVQTESSSNKESIAYA